MKYSLLSALAPFLAAAPALAGTITVDDDQPADFATIQAAIDAASPGDVILVSPGSYPGFYLDKSLSVLGPAGGPRPAVTGWVIVTGPGPFQLAGFDLRQLTISNVPGRGAIDDCRLLTPGDRVLEINGSSQILVTRCLIEGQGTLFGGSAAAVASSTVTFTDCTLAGSSGLSPEAGDGADGLQATGANVMLAGCDVYGGSGGSAGFGMIYGYGGSGVVAQDSTVVLRGNGNKLAKGSTGDPSGFGSGLHIAAPGSTVVFSGMNLTGTPKLGGLGATFVPLAVPEPFLRVGGSDIPGEARRLFLHGPNGATAFVVVSLLPANLSPPTIEGLVWVAPAGIVQILPLVTAGQSTPKTYLWPVPPSLVGLEGVALQVQAAFPLLTGALDPTKSVVTNPANAILRF